MTPRSVRAIANIREICSEHLQGHCNLRVIDLCQQPAMAEADQIVALPTLIRKLPPPLRRIIGDLSDREGVLNALDLKPPAQEPENRRQESGDRRQGAAVLEKPV